MHAGGSGYRLYDSSDMTLVVSRSKPEFFMSVAGSSEDLAVGSDTQRVAAFESSSLNHPEFIRGFLFIRVDSMMRKPSCGPNK